MSKKVISFRFSDQELRALDEACKRFGMNRSQAVNSAIRVLLHDYVDEGGTLLKRKPWFKTSLTEDDDEQNRSK